MGEETATVREDLGCRMNALTSGAFLGISQEEAEYIYVIGWKGRGESAVLNKFVGSGKGSYQSADLNAFLGLRTWSHQLADLKHILGLSTWSHQLADLNDPTSPSGIDLVTPTGPTGPIGEMVPFAWTTVTDLRVFPRTLPLEHLVEIPKGVGRRREPVIRGKGVPVWAIVSYANAYSMAPEEVSDLWDGYITPNEVRGALAYWRSHPEARDELAEEG